MPKRRVSRRLGSAAVVVRKKQTQELETRRLKPHPSSSSSEQEIKHTYPSLLVVVVGVANR